MINAVITYKDNSVSIHHSETDYVGTVFTPGYYEASTDNNGKLHINRTKLDESHEPYPSDENISILNTVNAFFQPEMKDQINKIGFTHKLGILLHGKQGCGKTSLLNFISQRLIERADGIVFFCDSINKFNAAVGLSKSIREVQPNPIIFIADEFERYAVDYESDMKNFLDGKDSINNMLFLAATNYIGKVPKTLSERPSRFKIVTEIPGISDKPTMKAIIEQISSKLDPSLFTETEIDDIVAETKTATLDDLKHICLDKLTNNHLARPTKNSIGFHASTPQLELNLPKLELAGFFVKRSGMFGKEVSISTISNI